MFKKYLSKILCSTLLCVNLTTAHEELIPLRSVNNWPSTTLADNKTVPIDPLLNLPEPIFFIIIQYSKEDLSLIVQLSKAYYEKFSSYYLKGKSLTPYSSATDILCRLQELEKCSIQEKHIDFLDSILPQEHHERVKNLAENYEQLSPSPLLKIVDAEERVQALTSAYPILEILNNPHNFKNNFRKACSILWRDPFLKTGTIALTLGLTGWGIYSLMQASITHQIDIQKNNENYWRIYHNILNQTISHLETWDTTKGPWPYEVPYECTTSCSTPFAFAMCKSKKDSLSQLFLEQNLTGHERLLFHPNSCVSTILEKLNSFTGASPGHVPYNWTSYLHSTYDVLNNTQWPRGWKNLRLANPSLIMSISRPFYSRTGYAKYPCSWRNGTTAHPTEHEGSYLFMNEMQAVGYADPVCIAQNIMGPQGSVMPPAAFIAWPIMGALYYGLLITSIWFWLAG